MATVAMVYNPVPESRECRAQPTGKRPEWAARYVASLEGPAALAEPLRRQAAQVGMEQAEVWVALSDGGSGLEDFLQDNFGRVDAVILDFWHAAEYLGICPRRYTPARTRRPTRGGGRGVTGSSTRAARRCWRRCGGWS